MFQKVGDVTEILAIILRSLSFLLCKNDVKLEHF